MLSDNIRTYRKKNNLSQDELAEKVGVSRQSVSFWETGQTQPTIDNMIALAKIFDISLDVLLGNADSVETPPAETPENKPPKKKSKLGWIIGISIAVAVMIAAVILAVVLSGDRPAGPDLSTKAPVVNDDEPTVPDDVPFDLFTYCKAFAIEIGELNGDYCTYQQPATNYGGYEDEYFSITYWNDSDRVEFCLHCPLSETQSHNFYLTMRGGSNGKYEYSSSKYYRDTGESFRYACGDIDPAVFSDSYPISCDDYKGSLDGQDEFMEQTRVGICDLIDCLKNFVTEEDMECDFSDFGFVNF